MPLGIIDERHGLWFSTCQWRDSFPASVFIIVYGYSSVHAVLLIIQLEFKRKLATKATDFAVYSRKWSLSESECSERIELLRTGEALGSDGRIKWGHSVQMVPMERPSTTFLALRDTLLGLIA